MNNSGPAIFALYNWAFMWPGKFVYKNDQFDFKTVRYNWVLVDKQVRYTIIGG